MSRRRGANPKQSWRKKYRQTSPTRARRHIGQDRRQVRADALLIWLAESKERKKGVDNDLQGLSEPTPSVRPSYCNACPAVVYQGDTGTQWLIFCLS